MNGGGGGNAGERVRLRLLISGRVQGVAYRYCMADQCRQLGVAGWVRNLHDGRVEARFEGDPGAVRAALEFVRQAPPHAQVEDVEGHEEEIQETVDGFRVR